MPKLPDPLQVPTLHGPDRLNYIQGTLLDTEDFAVEQTYHRGRLARGLQYTFGSGTVAGLYVNWRPGIEVSGEDELKDQEILVNPGMAIDPLGRLIEVPRAACLRLKEWFESQRTEDLINGWVQETGEEPFLIADVFLRFCIKEQGKTPAFAQGNFDATNAVASSRLRDDFELGLVVREEAAVRRAWLADPNGDEPQIPVPDLDSLLLSLAGDLPAQREAILNLWRDTEADWDFGTPPRLVEHLLPRQGFVEGDQTQIGRDPTSVLLARVRIPVTAPANSAEPPTHRLDGTTRVEPIIDDTSNTLRRFIYALGHLTQPVGSTP